MLPGGPVKKNDLLLGGILVLLFIAVNIFCAMFSEYYNLSSLLRQMPVYLAEVFMMLPMAYILGTWRDRYLRRCDRLPFCNNELYRVQRNAPFIVVVITALGVGKSAEQLTDLSLQNSVNCLQ